jgi:hypothetical protein
LELSGWKEAKYIVARVVNHLGRASRVPPGRMKMGDLDRFGTIGIDLPANQEAGNPLVL